MSNPVERIKRFIDARTGVRGLDPNIVHGINTNGEQENLTLSDLRAILADLEMAEKALTQAGEFIDDLRQDLHIVRQAVVVIHSQGRVSVSGVQRRLGIGWNQSQLICQHIVNTGIVDDLELSPTLTPKPHP